MKDRAHHVSISAQGSLFCTATVITAILISIAIVQRNLLALAAITGVGLTILLPVEVSLGTFAALVPFDGSLVLGKSGTTITWVAGAYAGAILAIYGLLSGRFKSPPPAGLYWGLFALWSCASMVWAIDPSASLKVLPTVATLFALYIVAVSFQVTRRELSRICLLAVAGGTAAALFVIFQYGSHFSIEGRASMVLGDTESDPNFLSSSLLLPLSLAFGGVLSEQSPLKKAGLWVALVVMTISVFLAMSRGALIALSVTVLICLYRVGVRRRILIPILVLAIPLFFLPDLFYERLEEASRYRGSGRYDVWLAGLEIVKHYPVIGVGLNNFSVAYRNVAGYAHVFNRKSGYTRDAHNSYLLVCAETGVIGLALFILAIWSQLRSARRVLSSRSPCDYFGFVSEAACWGQLVAGLSLSTQWTKPLWLAFILLAQMNQRRGESELDDYGPA